MIPENNIKVFSLFLLLAPGLLMAADDSERERKKTSGLLESSAQTSGLPSSPQPNRRPSRLKFRDGPVCMCSRGMSEADIQAGMKKKNNDK
jgi:hypothetical protein